ncbi:MAG: hypothetical protein FJ207_10480 [Gemmatimonadetes bacterium]|nr:hypothetical protein [Gemmatimonadota bacterium]
MTSEESLWYRLGYALEGGKVTQTGGKARPRRAGRGGRPRGGRTEREGRTRPSQAETERESALTDDLVTAGIAAAAARLLDAWQPSRKAGWKRLAWAGAAGAAATLLIDLLKPVLRGKPELPEFDRDLLERLLAGAGQGLIYGAVVEPRVPGPPLLKGALFGSAEYAAAASGGLGRLLKAHAPQARLPLVGQIFEDADPEERAYLEHLAFGVALALLYGSSPSSNGTDEEGEGE